MPGAIAQRKIGAPHSSLYIGPAGWSYEDWEGIVYARPRVRGFRPLAYLAHYFNCVEINSTFYRIPPPSVADKWVAQVEPFDDFLFSVKLWEGFTHVPASGGQVDAQALKQWGAALDPLRRSDRLGAVLVQFPWSFRRTRANASYLDVLTENLTPDPLVIEMRHDSWNSKDYLAWLRERACAFCNIDQPLLSRCLPPTEHVTASLAYVRFHGRNRENWFREDAEVAERYKYLYSKEGLSDWVERFRRLIEKAEKVFVITNNHTEGRAVVNALQIKAMMSDSKVEAPPSLVRHYPELAEFTTAPKEEPTRRNESEQLSLL